MNSESELRQDLVSGDWVLIAPKRSERSKENFIRTKKRPKLALRKCVFEDIQKATNDPLLLQYGDGDDWRLVIMQNKFPALVHEANCPVMHTVGPYRTLRANGRHELIVTRDHVKTFAQLSRAEAIELFQAFAERYRALQQDPCLEYVMIFQNWGEKAGASQPHPHYQLIALPVIPPHVFNSLKNSRNYYEREGVCGHCRVIEWEMKTKTRIIYENEAAVAIAPYASDDSFEVRIFPKTHHSSFEDTPSQIVAGVADALRVVLGLFYKTLKDPDYNFFIHTSSVKHKQDFKSYHWHIEIVPKTNIPAGFELGTGIIINPVDPDFAAAALRKELP